MKASSKTEVDDNSFWDDPIEEEYSIYTLRYPTRYAPLRLRVFYVGMAVDPYKRFIQHLSMDGSNKEKDTVIRDIIGSKVGAPIMEIELTCKGSKAFVERVEAFFIEYYRAAGHPVTNKVLPLAREANYGRWVFEHEQIILKWHPHYEKVKHANKHDFLFRLFSFIADFFRSEEDLEKERQERRQSLKEYEAIAAIQRFTFAPALLCVEGAKVTGGILTYDRVKQQFIESEA